MRARVPRVEASAQVIECTEGQLNSATGGRPVKELDDAMVTTRGLEARSIRLRGWRELDDGFTTPSAQLIDSSASSRYLTVLLLE